MDLTALETNFTSWVEGVTGLTLHWRRQAPKALAYPFVEAELLAIRGKGHDEKFWAYDWQTDSNGLTLSGIRALSLTLHFLTDSQKLGESARQHAENFRTLIYAPSSLQTLADADLALVDLLGLNDTDFEDRSGRLISQVSVDIGFELRSCVPLDAGDYIQTVDVTTGGYVLDEYGNPVLDENGDFVATEDGDTLSIPGII